MKKRIVNVSICTVMILLFTLLFGYLHSVFNELNAMDLYHASARNVGIEITAISGSAGDADPEEIETAEYTKGYISKSMSDSGILNSVDIDYENQTIVCRVLTSGVTQAVQDGNEDEWDETCETARVCSETWLDGIREAGLNGWHFTVVILNDYYPKNALAVFRDGKTVYNCTRELTTEEI
jgi:hypothetical protein